MQPPKGSGAAPPDFFRVRARKKVDFHVGKVRKCTSLYLKKDERKAKYVLSIIFLKSIHPFRNIEHNQSVLKLTPFLDAYELLVWKFSIIV